MRARTPFLAGATPAVAPAIPVPAAAQTTVTGRTVPIATGPFGIRIAFDPLPQPSRT